ncbi:MAG: hypothetical protein V5A43_01410 [Haloarculaceae archaeon]
MPVSSPIVSRWARRYLPFGIGFLALSQAAALAGVPSRVPVVGGLQGFVCLVAFGKAYSLLPAYFDRPLAWPRAPAIHLPLAVGGVLALALAPIAGLPTSLLAAAGAVAWAAGVAVFLGTLAVTLRDNLTGAETGTSDASADRWRTDRIANAFVPVALAYLAVGSYELLAGTTGLPTLLDGTYVRVAHLLGAGFAGVLVFSVGFRLLTRFLVVPSPRVVPAVVLPAGALGPALIASGLYVGFGFRVGAVLEAIAVTTFAGWYLGAFRRSERQRVGLWGPLAGVGAGVVGVGLGLHFAFVNLGADLAVLHRRLNVVGFLGLTIVGLLYQFYPPAVGDWPGAGDRLAGTTIAGLAFGLGLAGLGPLVAGPAEVLGQALLVLSALGVGYLLLATMASQGGP